MLSIKTYKKLHCVKQTNLLVIFSKCNNKSFPDSISTKIMLVLLSKNTPRWLDFWTACRKKLKKTALFCKDFTGGKNLGKKLATAI